MAETAIVPRQRLEVRQERWWNTPAGRRQRGKMETRILAGQQEGCRRPSPLGAQALPLVALTHCTKRTTAGRAKQRTRAVPKRQQSPGGAFGRAGVHTIPAKAPAPPVALQKKPRGARRRLEDLSTQPACLATWQPAKAHRQCLVAHYRYKPARPHRAENTQRVIPSERAFPDV